MDENRIEELVKIYISKSTQIITFEESQAVVKMLYDIWRTLPTKKRGENDGVSG